MAEGHPQGGLFWGRRQAALPGPVRRSAHPALPMPARAGSGDLPIREPELRVQKTPPLTQGCRSCSLGIPVQRGDPEEQGAHPALHPHRRRPCPRLRTPSCTPDFCCSKLLNLVKHLQGLSLGALHPAYAPMEHTQQELRAALPDDCHLLASQRLGISLTHWPSGQNRIVTDFATKEELIQVSGPGIQPGDPLVPEGLPSGALGEQVLLGRLQGEGRGPGAHRRARAVFAAEVPLGRQKS